MRSQNFNIISFGFFFIYAHLVSVASANTELSKMRDCTEVDLEAVIDQDASREDNLARLSEQFFQSVNKIEHCDREQNSVDAASSTAVDSTSSSADTHAADSTASADGDAKNAKNAGTDVTSASSEQMAASSDSENPTSQSGGQSGEQSTSRANRPTVTPTASGSLVGTNFDQTMTDPAEASAAPSASNMAGTKPQTDPAETNTAGAQIDATKQDLRLTNRNTPDDIRDTDNDSVFEAQIRAAAMAETDPDTKKNLWNEYRRYKGLPEQK